MHISYSFSGKCRFVTAIGNSSISLAHTHEPDPFSDSHSSGKPPIPSNRLAIVRSVPQQTVRRYNTYSHGGRAMLLPSAL